MNEDQIEVIESDKSGITKDAQTWGMFCHLSSIVALVAFGGMTFVGPLICWLVKKNEYDFVDQEGKEALNFQITIFIMTLICLPLCIVFIGIPMLFAVQIYHIVCCIIGGIKANEGQSYRYPFCIRFIK